MVTGRSTVEAIEGDSKKFYNFQRYDGVKANAEKTTMPVPFILFEYAYNLFQYARRYLNDQDDNDEDVSNRTSFGKLNILLLNKSVLKVVS